MEIIKAQEHLLSNYETWIVLNELPKKINYNNRLATIKFEVNQYLEETEAHLMTPEIIEEMCQKFNKFELTKAEKLQILNNRPQSEVELFASVERCGDRPTEEEIVEILSTIRELFPRPPSDENDIEEN